MKALGLIETKGLVVAIESADAMLKAAEVSLVDKKLVGGGLVAITITGEVAAVKAAVDAGAAAVGNLCQGALISQHVIPRPHDELALIVPIEAVEPNPAEEAMEPETVSNPVPLKTDEAVESEATEPEVPLEDAVWTKERMDTLAEESGWEMVSAQLQKMKVVELRVLARNYDELGILGREISKADKKMLLEAFETYYRNLKLS